MLNASRAASTAACPSRGARILGTAPTTAREDEDRAEWNEEEPEDEEEYEEEEEEEE